MVVLIIMLFSLEWLFFFFDILIWFSASTIFSLFSILKKIIEKKRKEQTFEQNSIIQKKGKKDEKTKKTPTVFRYINPYRFTNSGLGVAYCKYS